MTLAKDIKIYFKMLFSYKPKTFWNELLSNSFDLRGVGHYRMSNEENLKMYEEKKKIISDVMTEQKLNITDETNILEIGCGVGYWTEYLKSLGAKHYTGNDIAEVSIQNLSKQYPEYSFIHGDISETPLPQNKFDLAFMIDVTQHITDNNNFNKAISNIWNSVKPGGFFMVTIWDPAKNVYLANKIRINRIEKPRGLDLYTKNFEGNCEVVSKTNFNDKYLLLIKKLEK
jgi:SAM-dependent methyltransferase